MRSEFVPVPFFTDLPSARSCRSTPRQAAAFSKRIAICRYELGDTMGSGSFGTVRRAVDRKTGKACACKSIPKLEKRKSASNRHYLLKIRSEVDSMSHLGASLDAVYLFNAYEDDTDVHLVMELCEGGTLAASMDNVTEHDAATIMRSILRFLAQCHSRDLVYRDVKPENFLFTSDSCERTVKAIDFGLTVSHQPGSQPLDVCAGTPLYVAPEVFKRNYGKKSDVYSAGVLAFQLLTGRYPYWATKEYNCNSMAEVRLVAPLC